LEATSILLGGNNDDYCERVSQKLVLVVKMTQRAVQVRGAALKALSMAYFVCSSNVGSSDRILDLCEQVCAPEYRGEEVPASLRATALDCWALLSTTIEDVYLAGSDVAGNGDGRGLVILPLLSDCLNSTNLDLRCAAGECVALIHEARLDLGIEEDEGENASERRYRRGESIIAVVWRNCRFGKRFGKRVCRLHSLIFILHIEYCINFLIMVRILGWDRMGSLN